MISPSIGKIREAYNEILVLLMTNASLLQQLDTLRENYSRQQKAATVLQASLKSMTDAQNRVQKALTDYREQNTGTDVSNSQSLIESARLKDTVVDPLLPDLRRELKTLGVITSALKDAAAALRNDPLDVVRFAKALAALQTVPQANITSLLPELNTELELGQRALGDEFGERLRDALAQQGIQIRGRGTKFVIGRFELNANFVQRVVTIRYGQDIVIPRAPITVEAAVKAYQNAAKLVTERQQDGKTWMAQFYDAYQVTRLKRNADSARVNLVDCYIELVLLRQGRAFVSEPSKRTFSEYTRAQFIYDFYELTNQQRLAHNGQYVRAHVATKSQTDNPIKSMWIVEGDSPYDGRYIADVEFVRD